MNYYETHYISDTYDMIYFKNYNYTINDNIIINNRAIHNDIVYYVNNLVVGIKVRNMSKIAGILHLNKNIKYGFNSRNMPYYIFTPLNNKYPTYLVASSLKSKSKQYIIITFNKWPTTSKYPYGQCTTLIGNIDNCENIYNVLLYKYNLVFNTLKIDHNTINNHKNIDINNITYNVFSIDPLNCTDIDDALSINIYDTYIEIGIHITDVTYYINNIEHLLNNLTTSIYMKYRQINMLPNIYANTICSLIENTKHKCISVIFKFSHNYELLNCNIKLTNVYVEKNFSYDEADSIIKNNNNKYKDLLNLWNFMINYNKSITDTHILIEKLMILTNHKVASILYNYDKINTILRVHEKNKNHILYNFDNNKLNKYLEFKTFNSAIYQKNVYKPNHYGLNTNLYTHFTSPLRRTCDIITHLNIKNYLENKPLLNISNNKIEHINKVSKNIKKMYYDCKLVDLLNTHDNSILTIGYIVDFNYKKFIIYIPDLDIEYKIKYYSNKLDNLYSIIKADNNLEIKYENIVKSYKKYDLVNLEIYFIKNSDKLEDKIKIKILN